MLSGISDAVNTPLYPPVANPPTQKWLHSTGRHPKPRVGLAATPAITAVLYTMGGPVQIHSFSAEQQMMSKGISAPWGRFPLLICRTGRRGYEIFALNMR